MWLTFAFLSAALLGFYDVFKKRSLRNNAVMPVLFLNTLFCTLLFVPFILGSSFGWVGETNAVYIPQGGWEMHRLILLKSCIVLLSWICGYFGMKHLPLTIVGPINATRPVLVLLGALFVFGERLNLWQWVGVLLAICSFFLLSRSGRKEGIRFAHNQWIGLIVLAAFAGAASGLYDKYLMSSIENGGAGLDKMAVQSWYNVYQCLMMAVMLVVMWWPRRQSTTPFHWDGGIVFISLFLTVADLAYFYALSFPDAMISIVSMVRRSSVLVSFLFGAILFREKNLKAKALDLFLVLLGMICLWLGT
ncbi:MAG: DMT family transporter [Bacteroidaceae bacterium]